MQIKLGLPVTVTLQQTKGENKLRNVAVTQQKINNWVIQQFSTSFHQTRTIEKPHNSIIIQIRIPTNTTQRKTHASPFNLKSRKRTEKTNRRETDLKTNRTDHKTNRRILEIP